MVTKLQLNLEAIRICYFLSFINASYEKEMNHILLSKYKNRHNKHADSNNIDKVEEKKEIYLNKKYEELKLKIIDF